METCSENKAKFHNVTGLQQNNFVSRVTAFALTTSPTAVLILTKLVSICHTDTGRLLENLCAH